MKTLKILFVCHGNICRSPMAESVMAYLLRQNGMDSYVQVASAATSTEEIGNPVHHGTVNILKRHSIPLVPHRAVQMRRDDYGKYDYIIGMDQWNEQNILRILGGDSEGKVYSLLDFSLHPRAIADPWYTGDFVSTYNDITEGCEALLRKIKEA